MQRNNAQQFLALSKLFGFFEEQGWVSEKFEMPFYSYSERTVTGAFISPLIEILIAMGANIETCSKVSHTKFEKDEATLPLYSCHFVFDKESYQQIPRSCELVLYMLDEKKRRYHADYKGAQLLGNHPNTVFSKEYFSEIIFSLHQERKWFASDEKSISKPLSDPILNRTAIGLESLLNLLVKQGWVFPQSFWPSLYDSSATSISLNIKMTEAASRLFEAMGMKIELSKKKVCTKDLNNEVVLNYNAYSLSVVNRLLPRLPLLFDLIKKELTINADAIVVPETFEQIIEHINREREEPLRPIDYNKIGGHRALFFPAPDSDHLLYLQDDKEQYFPQQQSKKINLTTKIDLTAEIDLELDAKDPSNKTLLNKALRQSLETAKLLIENCLQKDNLKQDILLNKLAELKILLSNVLCNGNTQELKEFMRKDEMVCNLIEQGPMKKLPLEQTAYNVFYYLNGKLEQSLSAAGEKPDQRMTFKR